MGAEGFSDSAITNRPSTEPTVTTDGPLSFEANLANTRHFFPQQVESPVGSRCHT